MAFLFVLTVCLLEVGNEDSTKQYCCYRQGLWQGVCRYIVPGLDRYRRARDWRNISVFVTNKVEIM